VRRGEWQALRVGDRVLVHHVQSATPERAIASHVVAVHERSRIIDNEVGVCRDADAGGSVAWPARLQVHAAGDAGSCPWCALASS
jgi:hypothetical protein